MAEQMAGEMNGVREDAVLLELRANKIIRAKLS
jgi:hypothetical protein